MDLWVKCSRETHDVNYWSEAAQLLWKVVFVICRCCSRRRQLSSNLHCKLMYETSLNRSTQQSFGSRWYTSNCFSIPVPLSPTYMKLQCFMTRNFSIHNTKCNGSWFYEYSCYYHRLLWLQIAMVTFHVTCSDLILLSNERGKVWIYSCCSAPSPLHLHTAWQQVHLPTTGEGVPQSDWLFLRWHNHMV